MAATALVQARIDPELRDRAAHVLGKMGMTLSDAVRILLTRVANEGGLPVGLTTDPQAYDAWFKSKVMEALAEHTPAFQPKMSKRISPDAEPSPGRNRKRSPSEA